AVVRSLLRNARPATLRVSHSRVSAYDSVRRGDRRGPRPGPTGRPPGTAGGPDRDPRIALRPARAGSDDKPRHDPRLRARLHVQNLGRRTALAQPHYRLL